MRDFHTHNCENNCVRALVSAREKLPDKLCSWEMHPWFLPEVFNFDRETFCRTLQPFDALGEVGLDKLRGPETIVQQQFLESALSCAVELDKPVVFHCVKSMPLLEAVLKKYPVKRKMFHGFRNSPEMLKSLWRQGFTVSFHRSVVNNQALLYALRSPCGSFGFESDDDASCDVQEVIEKCIRSSGNADLEKLSDEAFEEFVDG